MIQPHQNNVYCARIGRLKDPKLMYMRMGTCMHLLVMLRNTSEGTSPTRDVFQFTHTLEVIPSSSHPKDFPMVGNMTLTLEAFKKVKKYTEKVSTFMHLLLVHNTVVVLICLL